jgi:hypothetical protein
LGGSESSVQGDSSVTARRAGVTSQPCTSMATPWPRQQQWVNHLFLAQSGQMVRIPREHRRRVACDFQIRERITPPSFVPGQVQNGRRERSPNAMNTGHQGRSGNPCRRLGRDLTTTTEDTGGLFTTHRKSNLAQRSNVPCAAEPQPGMNYGFRNLNTNGAGRVTLRGRSGGVVQGFSKLSETVR